MPDAAVARYADMTSLIVRGLLVQNADEVLVGSLGLILKSTVIISESMSPIGFLLFYLYTETTRIASMFKLGYRYSIRVLVR